MEIGTHGQRFQEHNKEEGITLLLILGVPVFVRGPQINSNSDINNLTDLPCYRSPEGAITASLSNTPSNILTALGFVLLNFQPYGSADWSTQVIVQLSHIWVRQKNNNSYSPVFTPWKEVAYTS